ncbi:hypothetical protein ACFQU9_37690 [Actinomadura namibiensis]|uniref:Sel1 repeat family protein n=1 Tax=Actinomadura namibiensis TaxID=182080 RepID=A0A7W3QK11_ACTNM|nr:hypothetical protein [Actinomadura namibiensis]MBA8949931.1 hypothetical protein [Actinomadura namibiensis]
MVADLLARSRFRQNLIARRSSEIAAAYKNIRPDLPVRLSESTISRMKTGSDLKKMDGGNLTLLHLTLARLVRTGDEGEPDLLRDLRAAISFAEKVLDLASESEKPRGSSYNPNDPRHYRASDLFGDHGVDLLEQALERKDAGSFRKLAVLQQLSGNSDDARFWNHCASEADPAMQSSDGINDATAAQEAFRSGRQYLYSGQGGAAEIYLTLAASKGHADAAYVMGDLFETRGCVQEARQWFSVAKSYGHSNADARLSSPALQ